MHLWGSLLSHLLHSKLLRNNPQIYKQLEQNSIFNILNISVTSCSLLIANSITLLHNNPPYACTLCEKPTSNSNKILERLSISKLLCSTCDDYSNLTQTCMKAMLFTDLYVGGGCPPTTPRINEQKHKWCCEGTTPYRKYESIKRILNPLTQTNISIRIPNS